MGVEVGGMRLIAVIAGEVMPVADSFCMLRCSIDAALRRGGKTHKGGGAFNIGVLMRAGM